MADTDPIQSRWQANPFLPIALGTILMLLWALFIRATQTDEAFTFEPLREIAYEPYLVGLSVIEYAVVLLPLIFLMRTGVMKRILNRTADSRDRWQSLLIFIGLQALYILYRLYLIDNEIDWGSWGYLVPLLAGLLGGWPIGVATGIVAAITNGWVEYMGNIYWSDADFYLVDYIDTYLIRNTTVLIAIWVGFCAGWWREKRTFLVLLPLVLFGIFIDLTTFSLNFISYNNYPQFVTTRLFSNLLPVTLLLAGFASFIRFMQDQTLRRDAEAQQLQLSQTQLALSNTELALAQSELRALHAQINPHFFFNSLNTIRYFIRTDPEKARTLLNNLSQIFQRVLHAGDAITLRDEIETVQAYLELEEARLEERLNIVWTNLAESALDAPVPPLILQPIVENAVVHGIAPKPEGGTIHILLDKVENDLLLQVSDDGVGFDPTEQMSEDSIALGNVTRRMMMKYGEGYVPVVQSAVNEGTKVTLRIPHTSNDVPLDDKP